MHWMTPNWTWTLNSQKYPIYSKYLPLRSIFWSVSLYGQRFRRFRTFYPSPLTTMLHGQKKNKKKLPKIQNFKFHYSFNNFVRDPPKGYTWILGTKSGVLFQRRCRLKLLPPYCPMLTETKTNWQKSKIWNFTILWAILVETLPRSMHDFFGVNVMCTFTGDVVWIFFSHVVQC